MSKALSAKGLSRRSASKQAVLQTNIEKVSKPSDADAGRAKAHRPLFDFQGLLQMSYSGVMSAVDNPALQAFLAHIGDELVWAQIVIRNTPGGYELRHVEDRVRAASELRGVSSGDARQLAQFTAESAFRPLRAAPDLQSGWRMEVRHARELELALNRLYPGSIADWYAAQSPPPVTNYREFTGRQTGMYQLTTKLSDAQVALVIRACCHVKTCLKRRLWSVAGLEPDAPEAKSAIPCLEGCAVFLEFARQAARLDQAEKVNLALEAGELGMLSEALENALARVDARSQEADVERPAHQRQLRLLLEKLRATLTVKSEPK